VQLGILSVFWVWQRVSPFFFMTFKEFEEKYQWHVLILSIAFVVATLLLSLLANRVL
jgi:hypothetical protein